MAIAVCVMAVMMVALSTQYARTYTLARQAARLEQHRLELIGQNESLREEIRRLQTDDRYIERLARQQLGLVRPGEIELLIVPAGSGHASSSAISGRKAGPETRRTPPPDAAGSPDALSPHEAWTARLQSIIEHLFGWVHRPLSGQ